MKKITSSTFILAFLFPLFLISQNKQSISSGKCFSDEYNAQQLLSNPRMMGSEAFKTLLSNRIQEMNSQGDISNRGAVITIPTVVHVLHNGEAIGEGPNISDAQVLSQITVMNEDYRRMMGTPGYNTHADGADVEVEFVLAQQTPDGCPTNGIDRVNICQDGTNSAAVDYWKTQTYWDPSMYMNMWSSKYVGDLNGILGFAQFPGGTPSTDGVSSSYNFFGSSDYDDGSFALSAPYDKGRTMTHEVGHYLGLYHTFQGGCTGSGDFCADTPAVDSPNYGCPTGHVSCGTTDMIENYMDYTDDSCMNIFTNDQKARIVAVLTTISNRMELSTSVGASPPASVGLDAEVGIASLAPGVCGPEFDASVTLKNWGTTTMTSATISYDLDGMGSQNYNWSGSLASNASTTVSLGTISSTAGTHDFNVSVSSPNGSTDARSCNDSATVCITLNGAPTDISTTQVHLSLTTDNYCEETSWELLDSAGNVVDSYGPYAQNFQDNMTFTYDIDVISNECYLFVIYDAYGDGICCDFGTGSYELRTDDNTLIVSGGSFEYSESTPMGNNLLSTDDYLTSNLSIYPNPVKEQLNIKLINTGDLPDGYKVYNSLGQIIMESEIHVATDLNVNTSAISNGLYFIKISKNGNSIAIPFVKE